MKTVLASSNKHKAAEITAMLPPSFDIRLQSDLGIEAPPETGLAFVENALIKARHASDQTNLPAIADDSGLCVKALGGRPGIISARYAGENATDHENLEKLLPHQTLMRSSPSHPKPTFPRSFADVVAGTNVALATTETNPTVPRTLRMLRHLGCKT